jgi:hypothetical protein
VVGIVRRVDLTAVTARAVAVTVAVGEVALAGGYDANPLLTAARGGSRDHARATTFCVAAKVRIRPGNADSVARFAIRRAALLQGVGAHDQ